MKIIREMLRQLVTSLLIAVTLCAICAGLVVLGSWLYGFAVARSGEDFVHGFGLGYLLSLEFVLVMRGLSGLYKEAKRRVAFEEL